MPSLRFQLESLPQELYDQIYNHISTAPKAMNLIEICRKLRLARFHLLHVDRTFRAQYAKSYYTNTAFAFDHVRHALIPWLLNIPREQVRWIEKLAYESDEHPLECGFFLHAAESIVARDFGKSIARKVGAITRSEVRR